MPVEFLYKEKPFNIQPLFRLMYIEGPLLILLIQVNHQIIKQYFKAKLLYGEPEMVHTKLLKIK